MWDVLLTCGSVGALIASADGVLPLLNSMSAAKHHQIPHLMLNVYSNSWQRQPLSAAEKSHWCMVIWQSPAGQPVLVEVG
jgi:hypothetical protein